MAEKKIVESNSFCFRYAPNSFLMNMSKQKNVIEVHPKYEKFGESITDKESYKLNLSTARGAIASATGSVNKGSYMFDDGKYDITKDFSYALRPDISIVQLDNYMERLKNEYDKADSNLQLKIKEELATAEKVKAEKVASEKKSEDTSLGE